MTKQNNNNKKNISTMISNSLDPDENILFNYSPYYSPVKNRTILIIGIIALIFIFVDIILAYLDISFISVGFVMVSFIVFFIMAFWFLLVLGFINPSTRWINKTKYIFTNKKFILIEPKEKYLIEFENISTLITEGDKTSHYVVANLIRPMKWYSIDKFDIKIYIFLKNKEITEQIYNLIKEHIKTFQ